MNWLFMTANVQELHRGSAERVAEQNETTSLNNESFRAGGVPHPGRLRG